MIVLAFVLCWLPFHVGRTIFSLSFGTTATDPSAELDGSTIDDMPDQMDVPVTTQTYTAPPSSAFPHYNSTITPYPDTHLYFLYYLSQYFNLVSSVLFYLSPAINPLLYNVMSGRYRLAVRSLLQQPESPGQTHRTRTFTIQQSSTTV